MLFTRWGALPDAAYLFRGLSVPCTLHLLNREKTSLQRAL